MAVSVYRAFIVVSYTGGFNSLLGAMNGALAYLGPSHLDPGFQYIFQHFLGVEKSMKFSPATPARTRTGNH